MSVDCPPLRFSADQESTSRLLDHFKVFTSFYRISDLRSREDLAKAIIEHVDYTM